MYIATIIVISFLVAFAGLTILSYLHAYSMLHYRSSAEDTPAPEKLSLLQKILTILTGVKIARPTNIATPKEYNLEYSSHSFKSYDGTNIAGWYIPHKNANGLVMLFHGYHSPKSFLLPAVKAFNSIGYSTFIIDFRGSGESDLNFTTIGYQEAEDVKKTIDYVKTITDYKRHILYGHSMGGAAVMRSAAELHIQPDAIIVEAVFNTMLDTVKNRFQSMGMPSFPCAHFLTFWGGFQFGFSAFKHNPVDYAKKITIPTLVINGGKDPRAKIEEAREVYENIAGNKEFLEFQDAEHVLCCEEDSEKWKSNIADFLNKTLN